MDDPIAERILYTWHARFAQWSQGQVQVTDKRVAVGQECWRIADLQDAQITLVPHESRRGPPDWNPLVTAAPGCWIAVLGLVAGAVLLGVDLSGGGQHPLMRLLAVVLAATSLGG